MGLKAPRDISSASSFMTWLWQNPGKKKEKKCLFFSGPSLSFYLPGSNIKIAITTIRKYLSPRDVGKVHEIMDPVAASRGERGDKRASPTPQESLQSKKGASGGVWNFSISPLLSLPFSLSSPLFLPFQFSFLLSHLLFCLVASLILFWLLEDSGAQNYRISYPIFLKDN